MMAVSSATKPTPTRRVAVVWRMATDQIVLIFVIAVTLASTMGLIMLALRHYVVGSCSS
jgi:hypothetical protein